VLFFALPVSGAEGLCFRFSLTKDLDEQFKQPSKGKILLIFLV
jgi:hypothetical protein